MFKDAVLAEYVRDGVVESEHRGFLAVLNADGSLFKSLGDIDTKIFPRSTVKCFQASAMVRSGLDLEPRLLALAQSSHSGGAMHMDGAREILASVGLTESALQCATDRPLGDAERRAWGDQEPAQIAMNCSGKHAAMLATCVKNGWPIETYLEQSHPLQIAIKKELEDLSGEVITLTSTDGCGAPLFLISVIGLARAIRAITISNDLVHQSVMNAARAFPEMVGGMGRHNTEMMQQVPGLFMKDGAEAVNVCSLSDGRTIVFKVSDGSLRAFRTIVHACLKDFGIDTALTPEKVMGGPRVIGTIRATI
ncbi:MAG: asparaginase [Actinomycetota bacterium]